ncbi:MAG: tetratricopeptide repeat protein [Bacteroidota bacterium]
MRMKFHHTKAIAPLSGFHMMARIVLINLLFTMVVSLQAQNERKEIRQGLKSYETGDFSEAEVRFRKAADINGGSFEAAFNTGASLYGQKKYDETLKQYESLVDQAGDVQSRAGVWHNMGNSLLQAQKYAESIEAYKNSLRLNPGDEDSRYNLAYAKQKLQEQQQQQQQNKDQQNQDQKDQQQQDKEQQNQDQKDQQEQDQQQQDKEQQQQDKEQQNQDQKEQQDKEQPQPRQISKEDAERLLGAIQQQEKDVKEKVDKKKAAAAKVKTEKDW